MVVISMYGIMGECFNKKIKKSETRMTTSILEQDPCT